jgi:hydrogenase-4 component B
MLKLFFALFIEKNEDAKRQEEFDRRTASYIRPESAAVLLFPAVLLPIGGMTPSLTMDRIAAMGQRFFGLEETGHAVHYFAFANLKGGLISIGIGIVLYIVVIRGCLMENGRYMDRWPAWLDLENTIYRPVIVKALPAVCGFVCGLIDRYCISVPLTGFMAIAKVVCRSMDHLTDSVILLARRTTHRQIPSAYPHPHSEHRQHLEDTLQTLTENLRHSGMLVEESFSFGLMMAVTGLCMTLVFLLVVFLRG